MHLFGQRDDPVSDGRAAPVHEHLVLRFSANTFTKKGTPVMKTTHRLFFSCLFCCFTLPFLNGYSSETNTAEPAPEPDRKAGERMTLSINGVEYAFRWCPPGTFTMGSPQNEANRRSDDETQHRVTLSHGFWMLETQVTQAMWESVMGNNPSFFKGDKLPVEQVSWNDCQEFIAKLNAHLAGTPVAPAGFRFSLPTEAQWEYACRAGTTTAYHFGDTLTQQQANFNGNKTKDVGSYPANAWGLYDMHGNVSEWCADWYGYYPRGAVTDPAGVPNGSFCVSRGGGWTGFARHCRSAVRFGGVPSEKNINLGLRLILSSSPLLLSADRVAFRGADGNDKFPDPRLPASLAQLPPPYSQMGTLVWEAIAQGNEAEADRIAQVCIKLAETQDEHPDLIFALHFRLGQMLLNAEMYDSAHRYLSEFVKLGGDVFLLARCKMISGDVDGGFSLFLNEIDRVPPHRTVLLQDMVRFFQQGYQPSEIMLRKTDDLMSRVETEEFVDPERIRFIADYWIVRNEPERAIPLYQRAILLYEEVLTRDNLDDSPVPAWIFRNNLAMLYSEVHGQHRKALEIMDEALATNRDNVTLLNIKGLILINAGNPTGAIPVLQRVVELSDQLPIFCMHLAYAFYLDGRNAESRQYFVAARDQLIPLVPTMSKENKAMYDVLMAAYLPLL